MLAAYTIGPEKVAELTKDIYLQFPVLEERKRQYAGSLSGGEQRMLSLGMALMTEPIMLMLDEPSMGLAPRMVDDFMETITQMGREKGLGILLVEQNIEAALRVADRVYVLRAGEIILEDTGAALLQRGKLWELF
jgi:branched-chain amino acid transport system ATP-binding protein